MSHLDSLSLRELRQLAYAKMRLPIVEEQERQACRGGLIKFVRYFWHVLEPRTKLVEGWPLEAVCEHLEAVHFGEITRLLINVPPGFMKSLLTDVFLPAWEWGPMNMPHLRYVTFSYSADLTMRDNGRFRDLLMSPEYQKLWGHRFTLRKVGEERVTNTKTGWKFASSVGGVGTGERGDRVVCFPYWETVQTEHGPMQIGDIVKSRARVRVWSLNPVTQKLELKPVIGWHENPGAPLLRIELDGAGAVTCTQNHCIRTPFGYCPASSLFVGDELLAAPSGMLRPNSKIVGAQGQVEVLPYASVANSGYGLRANPKFSAQDFSGISMSLSNLAHEGFCEVRSTIPKRSMHLTVCDILRSGAILKITQARIGPVTIFMADFLARGRRAYKRLHHHLMSKTVIGTPISPHGDARVALVENRTEDTTSDGHRGSITYGLSGEAANSSEVRNIVQGFKPDNLSPDFLRISAIHRVHEIPSATYCLTVEGNHNMLCGDGASIVCSNCDDPHKVKEAESELVRATTVTWFQETMENRLNDIQKSAIIVIMQRVHELDVSGAILDEGGYCHLMIPMRFDATRNLRATEIGWLDPRAEDGEWAWPERFPPDSMAKFERRPYMWSGQYLQMPTPRGGGIIKADSWQLWPGEAYPQCELVLASLDTASTEKEQNDASALTIWGIFRDGDGSPKAILLYAWEGRLEINDLTILVGLLCSVEKRPDSEYHRALALFNRGDEQTDALYRVPVDRLLVENKNNGISVAHELIRLFGHSGNFAVELIDPKQFGDKVARIIACEPMFADEMVYAPDRAFAERVIENVSAVPKTSRWDTPDSVSQALLYMRKTGILLRKDEQARVTHESLLFKPNPPPLY